jgi:hypothetical protein
MPCHSDNQPGCCMGCPMCVTKAALMAGAIVYWDRKLNADGSLLLTAMVTGGVILTGEAARRAMCAAKGIPCDDWNPMDFFKTQLAAKEKLAPRVQIAAAHEPFVPFS